MKTNETKKTGRKVKGRRKNSSGSKGSKKANPSQKGHYSEDQIKEKFEKRILGHRIKYEDVGEPLDSGRLNQYWAPMELVPYFIYTRSGGRIPQSFKFYDHRYLLEHFGLKGWEFGNWVSQEDRMMYVCAVGLSLLDMNRILGFRQKEIGLAGKLTMAIGARGKSKALAHFEPHTFAINLTRWSNSSDEMRKMLGLKPLSKIQKFLGTGGVGALAHEYGHALDYFFGGYYDQDPRQFALTDGRSIRTRFDHTKAKKGGLRGRMEVLLGKIIWDEPNKTHTAYYGKMRDFLSKRKVKSDYYYRRNELFARFFEQYIRYELKEKGIMNSFLSQTKYEAPFYMDEALLKKLVPEMRLLIKDMRTLLKS